MRGRWLGTAFGLALLIAIAGGRAWASYPELRTWTREGTVFADVSVNNPDIVALGGGQFRAYFMQAGQVKSAFSADGQSFAIEDGIRMDAAGHPALVRLPDGRLRLYYASTDPADGGTIESAVSEDGLAFVVEEGVRLRPGSAGAPDEGGIIHLDVIKLPGGGFRMYYDAVGPSRGDGPNWRGIRSARSMDGLRWRKDDGYRIRPGRDPIAFADLVWSPFVERTGGVTKLYFSLETDRRPADRVGIYLATSSDGLDFSIHTKHRVLGLDPDVGTDPGYGDGGMLGLPQDAFIIDVAGGRRLFYWQAEEGTLSAFLALP